MTSMIRLSLCLTLASICLAGCDAIQPASMLTLEPIQPSIDGPVEPIRLGFSDVVWTPEGEDCLVVGVGSAREGIGRQASPPTQIRRLYISRDPGGGVGHEYLITLLAESSLFQINPYSSPPMLFFQGALPAPTRRFMDQIVFNLDRIRLTSPNNEGPIGSVFVSGQVVANFTNQTDFLDKKAPFVEAAQAALANVGNYRESQQEAMDALDARP